MIITKEYIEWFEQANDDSKASVYNHSIYTLSSMKIKDSFMIALEILLGKKFCVYVSRNQKK